MNHAPTTQILSAAQTKQWDAFTIKENPISSINLMEQASMAFTEWFAKKYAPEDQQIYIFCGIGNNGGDGFAVARLLAGWTYDVQVIHCLISNSISQDCAINKDRLKQLPILELNENDPFPAIQENSIIIDALFGSGLNRGIEGYWGELIKYINIQNETRIAIDIPSGLFADQHSEGNIFKADWTVTFQLPKLAFFFAENQDYVGQWKVLNMPPPPVCRVHH